MQSLNYWHRRKWIVARFLSLWALVCTSPRIDACIRNAGETSNARRRRTLQGELPGPGWLVNKPPRFGLVSRVTKFHLSDSHAERMHVSRIHALLCTRACPRANTRAVIRIRNLRTRIYSVLHVRCTGADKNPAILNRCQRSKFRVELPKIRCRH